MATLLTARDLSKTFGTHTLFTGVGLAVHDGERLALIGPNGSGKSTLLKILAGLETPDEGELTTKKNLRLAYVAQDDRFSDGATPKSAVVAALGDDPGQALEPETRAAVALSKLGFEDHDRPVASLSGGWRKRLAVARALAAEPDVLMLDEPTNHLDLEGVLWLEQFVQQQKQLAMLFITHDRTFLETAATRVVELSRAYPGGTFEARGNYSEFVRRKEDFLEAQAAQQTALAGKVRRDTAWLKQGIQGRQTRNKSQVDAASGRRSQLKELGQRNCAPKQTASIDFQATERKTKRLLAVHGLTQAMGGKRLFDGLDFQLGPGDRLGLLGPNGSGKTTLLRLLAGELEPDAGTVKPAAELKIVRFTQHRASLNPTQKLREALCEGSASGGGGGGGGGDTVEYRGKPMHVSAWAKKFLFDPGQFNTSVGDLSGGEQARVLLAELMLKPADLLILDEPTNDLDIPSLEVLEQALTEFPGAIVLVTHDRFMLERLSTSLLALDGRGGAKTFADYVQWEKHRDQKPPARGTEAPPPSSPSPNPQNPKPKSPKLTFKLQHEMDRMEPSILAAEADLEALQQQAGDPQVMADHEKHAAVCRDLGIAQEKVDELYARWAELEELATG
jgi:ATP-binding cassette subfamily F protein uup